MWEFHGSESNGNGFGGIWWTDNPIYFSSIDVYMCEKVHVRACMQYWHEFSKCHFTHFPSFFSVHVDTYGINSTCMFFFSMYTFIILTMHLCAERNS